MNVSTFPAGPPATVFSALAELVYASDSYSETYSAICDAAPLLVPGCDHASLMFRRHDRFFTAAASDETARSIDHMERQLCDGPCVDAITDAAGQVDADLTVPSHWPTLAEWIVEHTPVRGMAGFRLHVDGEKTGALNLFADTPGSLSGGGTDHGAVFASFASVALMASAGREDAANLRTALSSNREIGQAVGLLMAFHKVSDDKAFEILKKTSQDMNLRLAEVAREVVAHNNRR